MNPNRSENTRKMDQIIKIIREQLSQGKSPIEVEEYLIEKGLPKQTAVTLIKMNLKPKAQSEQKESLFKAKTRQGREKEMTPFINEQVAQGKNQADIVDILVGHGISHNEAISLVVKIIGIDLQE